MRNAKTQQTSECNIKEADSQIQRKNRGERSGAVQRRGMRGANLGVTRLRCAAGHREYSQDFVVTVNGKQALKLCKTIFN